MTATGDDTDMVGDAVADVLRDRCTAEVVDGAEETGWAAPLWDAVAGGGFCWVSVPEGAGGPAVGGSVAQACAVLEQVGRFAAPLPVAETGLLGGWLLAAAGLDVPPGPVTTAPARVTLRRDGAGWVADGTATRVPWARAAERVVLLADSPDGPAVAVLDPARARVGHGANLAGEPRDTLHLDGAAVEAVAAAPAGVDTDALHRRGALSRAALVAGAAGRALELTVGYTNDRHQFGRPVARFQAVAAHLVRLAEQTEAVRMAARACAANAAGEPGGTPSAFDAAAAKAVASRAAGAIAAAAHQATGAMGMTREYELGRLTRRLWSWREEYGGEREWSTRLGGALAAGGADALWPSIARGAVA